jgi:hypothetical protein
LKNETTPIEVTVSVGKRPKIAKLDMEKVLKVKENDDRLEAER